MINLFTNKPLYLKWENDVIGIINGDYSVSLCACPSNKVVYAYFKTKKNISPQAFKQFLSERIFSGQRRDVHILLSRLGIKEYDVFQIAKSTRAFNLSDKFWIAYSESEAYEPTFTAVFKDLFHHTVNNIGDGIASPSGNNPKSYIFYHDKFGIAKQPLHPFSTDTVNEVIAYRLGKLLGVTCCKAEMISCDTVFSRYEYDFNRDALLHARNFTNGETLNLDNYKDIIEHYFPEARDDILRMILFDFITGQDDRHMSNWGFLMDICGNKRFYKLYDNGRSLFYEANEETLENVYKNPKLYTNAFGLVGDYFGAAADIAAQYDISALINLNINGPEIIQCFEGFDRYPIKKRDACVFYINWAVHTLKEINN